MHTWALPAPAGSAALLSSFAITIQPQREPALQPPPQESQAMGLLPTGCPLSMASSSSLPAPLAPGESRISVACPLPDLICCALSASFSLALPGTRVRGRSRVIWTLLITREPRLGAESLSAGWWPAVVQGYLSAGSSSCPGLPPSS